MRAFALGMVAALILGLGTVAVFVGPSGCKADPPGELESAAATFAKHRFLIGNRKQKNPLPDTPQTLADGKEAFSHYCIACHGIDGQNTGVPLSTTSLPPFRHLCRPMYSDIQMDN